MNPPYCTRPWETCGSCPEAGIVYDCQGAPLPDDDEDDEE